MLNVVGIMLGPVPRPRTDISHRCIGCEFKRLYHFVRLLPFVTCRIVKDADPLAASTKSGIRKDSSLG